MMREITPENLNKLVVKKSNSKSQAGQDIIYVCPSCGNVEKEFALSSRNYKNCSRCSRMSVKSTLLSTLNWVESDIQSPNYSGE